MSPHVAHWALGWKTASSTCVSAIGVQVAIYGIFFKPKCLCHVKSHPCESVIPCDAPWMCHPVQDKLPALSISQGTSQGGVGNG